MLGINDYRCLGYGYPCDQCTSFAFWRIRNDLGLPNFTPTYGGAFFENASTWLAAGEKAGIIVDRAPVRGDVVVFPPNTGGAGADGHVGVVLGPAPGGLILIEDYNWRETGQYLQHEVSPAGLGFLDFLALHNPVSIEVLAQ